MDASKERREGGKERGVEGGRKGEGGREGGKERKGEGEGGRESRGTVGI